MIAAIHRPLRVNGKLLKMNFWSFVIIPASMNFGIFCTLLVDW
jgi:hypothetical protein